MIIAVANTKGGTGKTTTAVQLALYRQSLGHEVWLVDGDEQQSALTAVSIRSENNVKPALACSAYSDARTLKSQIETQVNKWGWSRYRSTACGLIGLRHFACACAA